MNAILRRTETMGILLTLSASFACSHPVTKVSNSWNSKTAATYLDYRENWWAGWMGSARDHGTFCVSCHTAMPYALARPALRRSLGESGLSADEQKLLEDVRKRVRMWSEISPYYSDHSYVGKTAESSGTESVLNALILANHDAELGQLSDDTRLAFDNMWSLQRRDGDGKGAWPWLQFDEEPWEANGSCYYGAALAALAVGIAPDGYSSTPAIQSQLSLLRNYLTSEEPTQSTLSRVYLLWASTKLPGLLTAEQQKLMIQEVLHRQQEDGGWRLASIAWTWRHWSARSLIQMWLRADGTPMEGKSDGVATGLTTLVLQELGVPRENAQLRKGLLWLRSNQGPEGSWPASSLNKKRKLGSETGRFMSDAATAFAVMSLSRYQELQLSEFPSRKASDPRPRMNAAGGLSF